MRNHPLLVFLEKIISLTLVDIDMKKIYKLNKENA
jgi:hypothetical protein